MWQFAEWAGRQVNKKGAIDHFHPVWRELVFDIDMTDYNEVRNCCSDASICSKCWPLMTAALKSIHAALVGELSMALYKNHDRLTVFGWW